MQTQQATPLSFYVLGADGLNAKQRDIWDNLQAYEFKEHGYKLRGEFDRWQGLVESLLLEDQSLPACERLRIENYVSQYRKLICDMRHYMRVTISGERVQ